MGTPSACLIPCFFFYGPRSSSTDICIIMALWQDDTVVAWYPGIMLPEYHATVVLWYICTMVNYEKWW